MRAKKLRVLMITCADQTLFFFLFVCFVFSFFFLFLSAPTAYGSPQARDQIQVTAVTYTTVAAMADT